MNNLLNLEQWRILIVTTCSSLLGFFMPTKGFMLALVIMFSFNIWAGMRTDGVSIVRCKNFSFKKFKNAVCELFLYIFILEMIYSVMSSCGDKNTSIVVIKSLTYVFSYVYLQNAFKNLTIAYPKNKAFRIIYHVIRLEFKRAMPTHVQEIIDRIEREEISKEDK